MNTRNGLVVAAVLATDLLAWLAGRDEAAALLLAALTTWLVVPGLWVAAGLATTAWRSLLVAAAASLAIAVALGGWLNAGVLASLALAGVAGAWALRLRWRALPLLALTSLVLIPSVVLPMAGTSFPEATAEQLRLMREWYEMEIPADMSAADRDLALSAFDDIGARSQAMVDRFWPSLVLSGLISQTVLFMLAGWGVAHLTQTSPARPRLTPLAVWRAPFVTVWVLIGGLAASLAGDGILADVGWNLVVVATTFLVIQGLGVQAWVVRRVLSPMGQLMFWLLGGLLFTLALVGGGALIGLADQWMDLRRLRRPPVDDDET